jgi:hypothetical protein
LVVGPSDNFRQTQNICRRRIHEVAEIPGDEPNLLDATFRTPYSLQPGGNLEEKNSSLSRLRGS